MEMTQEKFEKIINALLSAKKDECDQDFGLFVERASVHLNQLGIWEEAKYLLKDYILMYWGFIEDAEFCNGEVRRKRT